MHFKLLATYVINMMRIWLGLEVELLSGGKMNAKSCYVVSKFTRPSFPKMYESHTINYRPVLTAQLALP